MCPGRSPGRSSDTDPGLRSDNPHTEGRLVNNLRLASAVTACVLLLGSPTACRADEATKEAVATIKKAGGKITFGPKGEAHVDLGSCVATKEVLAALKALPDVRSLDM